jgi:digalactosyldiacylglycerol synthase
VCADHPSNDFFTQFPNCLTFRNDKEFATQILWALSHEPQRLTPEQRSAGW